MRKFAAQRREPLLQRLWILSQVHENEAFPKPKIHRRQGVIGLIESGRVFHMRRAHQPAVQCVSPGMIWALNRRGVTTRFLLQSAPTVSAHIVKSSDLPLLISDYNQALVSDRYYEELARTGKLALVADQQPFFRKNLVLLVRKNVRRHKIFLQQRFGADHRRLEGFRKSACRLRVPSRAEGF